MEKKKRKFNVIDIIFIVIIVAAVAVVAVKIGGDLVEKVKERAEKREKEAECIVVLLSDDIPLTAVKPVKVGDMVSDDRDKPFGEIIDIKVGDAKIHGTNSEGMDVISPKKEYCSVEITVKVECERDDQYITVSDIKYYNNAAYTFTCGISKMWLRLAGITFTDDTAIAETN